MSLKNEIKKKGQHDLEVQALIKEEEAKELKKIIDAKDQAIDELTKKINKKINNLRKEGL